jgi:hypothetical protein
MGVRTGTTPRRTNMEFAVLPPAKRRQIVADAAIALDMADQPTTPADITIYLELGEADLPYVAETYETVRAALEAGEVR